MEDGTTLVISDYGASGATLEEPVWSSPYMIQSLSLIENGPPPSLVYKHPTQCLY